jgi:cytosine/adenosine deaminase-related metal-dependent hydrolase
MIVLKDATFIDWKSMDFFQGNVLIESGLNNSITLTQTLPQILPGTKIIDCKGKYVTKSFVNSHHHICTAFATGMPLPKKTPGNFYEILKYIWWKFDKSLDLETIKASAYVTAIACAKRGVTFVVDHHSSPLAIEGSLQTIADAFNEVGVNHLLSYEISDRDGMNVAKKALIETEEYLKKNQGLVGLHSSFTLTQKTLTKAVELARKYNTGVSVHVAEDLYDQENCYEIHSKRVIERYKDVGILDLKKSLLVHCLYLTDAERQLIRESGLFVVQNTESNLQNNVGQFSSCALGENIMLGTDGMHSDIVRASKTTYLTGQVSDTIDLHEIYRRFRKPHEYIEKSEFLGNGENNLVVLDYQPSTEFDKTNFLSHFVCGIDSSHIQHVIANGKLIVEDRKVTTVNEQEIKEAAKKLSRKLWDKLQTIDF